ncbi:MAG TPA: 50S ribosomal protein L24 [Gammaproteobacteria bacterium]|jgi:large subunit ribosomal protein L24|nr:50S ribosomal protein L24 [Gammaproteobacteria bacterium]
MNKIRKGDEVVVIAGKDKGRRGTVLKVLEEDDRVLVENVNMAKKHQRPNPNANVAGGIVEKEMSLHISNVMLYNPISKKGDRVGLRKLEDGRKVRFFKSNNEVVDV